MSETIPTPLTFLERIKTETLKLELAMLAEAHAVKVTALDDIHAAQQEAVKSVHAGIMDAEAFYSYLRAKL